MCGCYNAVGASSPTHHNRIHRAEQQQQQQQIALATNRHRGAVDRHPTIHCCQYDAATPAPPTSAIFARRVFYSTDSWPLSFFSELYRLCSACVNYLFCFLCFNDFCLTNYLNICRTDLHQICRNGRTMTVDERSEISPSRNAAVATNFCWFIGLTLHSIGFACYFTDDGVRQEMQMPAGPTKPIYWPISSN